MERYADGFATNAERRAAATILGSQSSYEGSAVQQATLAAHLLTSLSMAKLFPHLGGCCATISTEPSPEDREWFPEFAGRGDWMETLRQAWAEFRDESFVLQYLSPKLIRDFRLFAVNDDAKEAAMEVKAIHDEQGYKDVRRRLSRHYDVSAQDPDLQVTDADLAGSRRLVLTHRVRNGVLLDKTEAERTLQYLAQLWGYRVKLVEQDVESSRVLKEHEALPMP